MFTGIVEEIAIVKNIAREKENIHLTVSCSFVNELKIDQSVLHNGICLTVVAIENETFTVTAIKETIDVTTLGQWKIGQEINLERGMLANARLDGHIVQGHVDAVGQCVSIVDAEGSTYYGFEYDSKVKHTTIPKGSITIDGTSLTVVDSGVNSFSVAIIPYTKEHTLFKYYEVGQAVNLEFDVIGKYVEKLLQIRSN